MELKIIVIGELQTNCYIVACGKTKEAIVIDPGGEADKILEEINKKGYAVKQIVITHNHPDHTGALEELKKKTGAKVCMGEKEFNYNSLKIDENLKDAQIYKFGNLKYKVMHTPGHSPGSVCLVFEKEETIFSGDVLFSCGIGRTDLPGGSMRDMQESLKKLFAFKKDYVIYPGHGFGTTLEEEREENPYI